MKNKIGLLLNQSQSITLATFFVGLSVVISRFVAVINNSIIAAKFGTSNDLDVFLATQSIVDLIIAIFAVTLSVSFIPIYIGLVNEKKQKEASDLNDNLISFLLLTSAAIVALLIILTPNLVEGLFGFKDEKLLLAVKLLRLSSFSIIPLILTGQITNELYSRKRFFLPVIVSLFLTLIPSLSVIFLGKLLGIFSLSIAVLVSSFATFLLLLFNSLKKGYKFNFVLSLENKSFKKILKISFLLFISASAVQINVLIDRIFAAQLPTGSISALNYARTLRDIPLTLTMALPLTVLPFFAEKAFHKEELINLMEKIIKLGSYILMPASIGLFIVRNELVEILYRRGTFSLLSKEMTTSALSYLIPGIAFYWIITIFTRIFYSKKEFNTVVIVGILAIGFNILSDWILIKYLSFNGIALATSLMEIIFFFVYILLTKKLLSSFKLTEFLHYLFKILIISLLMGIILSEIKRRIAWQGDNTLIISSLKLVLTITLGIVIYIILSLIFKIKELEILKQKMLSN